jgi:hypothetical protein
MRGQPHLSAFFLLVQTHDQTGVLELRMVNGQEVFAKLHENSPLARKRLNTDAKMQSWAIFLRR